MLARVAAFIAHHGAVPGIQIAHAGRKASTPRPWHKGPALDLTHGGWEPVAPSAIAFREGDLVPRALSLTEIAEVQSAFAATARRALRAGFQWLEIHAAHGISAHEFFSPLSNTRTDAYGGSFENRARLSSRRRARCEQLGPIRCRSRCASRAPIGLQAA